MSHNTDHYTALYQSLINEKQRLSEAKTELDSEFRKHNIRMIEKELKQEEEFLASKGINVYNDPKTDELSDDELFNELMSD